LPPTGNIRDGRADRSWPLAAHHRRPYTPPLAGLMRAWRNW
jgi:hypothetical protein